jgi:hypothetical protein
MSVFFSRFLTVTALLVTALGGYDLAAHARGAAPNPPLREKPATRSYVSVEAAIKRDPFSEAPRQPEAIPSPGHELDLTALSDFIARDARPDPPQLDAELVLKATILGDAPVAYLTNGSAMRIVRVGDNVGGRKVEAIKARSIVLAGGMRLELLSASASPSMPMPRRFVRGRIPRPTPSSPQPRSTASALPMPPPTPAPAPTIRFGAYPLGSRPTSDPSAPTAFPYPYPYSPK